MPSKLVAAAVQKENMPEHGRGSFRAISRKKNDANDHDADDQPQDKKKKRGIVEQMNEPTEY